MSALLLLLCDGTDADEGVCGRQLRYAHDRPAAGAACEIAAARAWAAREHGWTSDGDRDLCPRHDGRPRPRLTLTAPAPAPAALQGAAP